MSKLLIKAQVEWLAFRAPSGTWVGVCDPMNLSTEASSLDELHSLIDESMNLLLTDLLEENELHLFLRERGWTLAPNGISDPETHDQQDIGFVEPWKLVVEGGIDTKRCAN